MREEVREKIEKASEVKLTITMSTGTMPELMQRIERITAFPIDVNVHLKEYGKWEMIISVAGIHFVKLQEFIFNHENTIRSSSCDEKNSAR